MFFLTVNQKSEQAQYCLHYNSLLPSAPHKKKTDSEKSTPHEETTVHHDRDTKSGVM